MRKMIGLLAAALVGAGAVTGAAAQDIPGVTLTQIPGSYSAPVALRAPHDGSGRLFIVKQGGEIRVFKNGAMLTTPFVTVPVNYSGESGLLGLAFHPNFGKPDLPHNTEFYVFYTRPTGDPRLGSSPDQVVARYTVPTYDSDVANPTGTIVLRIPDLASNHNGGDIHFGPDGYLYISSGDSGAQNNPYHFAECLWKKPATSASACGDAGGTQYYLLGKILRIDVDNRGGTVGAEMCGSNGIAPAEYSIPASNPHASTSNTCDEIWAHGFRNPWRMSFDRGTGDLVIGDVGQNQYEEITVQPAGVGGGDHGWSRCEGRHYFDASGSGTTCPATTGTIAPAIEYSHSNGCAVSGGYVYRGPATAFHGTYFYGDSCSSALWYATASGPVWDADGIHQTSSASGSVYGFGEDEAGNVYITRSNGTVWRIDIEHDEDVIFADDFE